MHHKFIPAVIGLMIIGGTGGLACWQYSSEAQVPTQQKEAGDPAAEYTLADVAVHNTSADCWAIINGSVYDLTTWIPRHPGGERAIEGLCGKDGSAAFNTQHSDGATQQAILADLKLGIVK